MDAIARESGVSKVTIYSYFPSKELLYGAAIGSRTEDDLGQSLFSSLDPLKPRTSLLRLARQFLKLLRADEVIGTYRALYSPASPQPQLAELFYRHGPLLTVQRLESYLAACAKAGSLRVTQPFVAAEQFFSLFMGLGHTRCLLGLDRPKAEDDERLLKANVEVFLRAFAQQST